MASFNAGHIILLTLIFLAFLLSKWQVTAAFLIPTIVLPFIIIFSDQLYRILRKGESSDIKIYQTGVLFAMGGIPIYLVIMLPLYYILSTGNTPLTISFPLSVAAIITVTFGLIATRPVTCLAFVVVMGCSLFHAFSILWLISLFNALA